MLRVWVIALVLTNVLLLAFQAMRPPSQRPQIVAEQAPPNNGSGDRVPTIHMLEELASVPDLQEGAAECFSAGPFESSEQREAALDLMAGAALSISARETEAIVDSGTWVYLPPLPDRETARNMALTMQDAGLGEVEVITGDEWNNAVSLGFYTVKTLAQQRLAEARSLGFGVESRTRRAIEPRYWLDYEQKLGAPYVTPSADTAIPPELHRAIPCAADSTGQAGES